MELTRNLRRGDVGDDVWELKQILYKLGYLKVVPTKRSFGGDTENAVEDFQASHVDSTGKQLDTDGVVGPLTIWALNKAYDELTSPEIEFFDYSRQIQRGDVGEDVWALKNILYDMGYLKVVPTKKYFGDDTKEAVKAFQRTHVDSTGKQLDDDGVVGPLTAWAINDALTGTVSEIITYTQYPNLSVAHINAINTALQTASAARVAMVVEILKYAYDDDASLPGPQSLYCIGANLYDTNLNLFIATEAYLKKRAEARPAYFTNGRLAWMIKQANSEAFACSDCSGAIIGLLRKFGYISKTKDATANGLCGSGYSSSKKKSALLPADFVGKSGHIGLYVGAGLAAEFAGGAYGCQLTNIDKRKCRNFVDGSLDTMSDWTKYRAPKFYS